MAVSMDLTKVCTQILNQLADLVHHIEQADYDKSSDSLSGSTIGQHLRHTLEFFICFEQGFEHGVINYDKRAHDKRIESNRDLALYVINRICDFVATLDTNKALSLEVGYDLNHEEFVTVETNAFRELIYNIEHAVHHMAIMKIGIREVAPYVKLPHDFGIAASTIRYKTTQPSH